MKVGDSVYYVNELGKKDGKVIKYEIFEINKNKVVLVLKFEGKTKERNFYIEFPAENMDESLYYDFEEAKNESIKRYYKNKELKENPPLKIGNKISWEGKKGEIIGIENGCYLVRTLADSKGWYMELHVDPFRKITIIG
jgi:hypothetical protein